MGAVKALDTTVGEVGPTYQIPITVLQAQKPLRFSVDIASGDTLVVYGRARSDDDWNELHTFTTAAPSDIYVSNEIKVERTVDGGVGDSEVFIEDYYFMGLEDHSA